MISMAFSTTWGLNKENEACQESRHTFTKLYINRILREHFRKMLPQGQKLELNFTFSCRKELSYSLNVANFIPNFAAIPVQL
jgi:hypothetical protein